MRANGRLEKSRESLKKPLELWNSFKHKHHRPNFTNFYGPENSSANAQNGTT